MDLELNQKYRYGDHHIIVKLRAHTIYYRWIILDKTGKVVKKRNPRNSFFERPEDAYYAAASEIGRIEEI